MIPLPVSIPDLTSPDLAVSAAVILSANTVPTTEQNADPSAAVQESVAADVKDSTSEGHNFQSNNNFVMSLDANSPPVTIHKLISSPLASRVSGKLQPDVWAN